MSERLDGRTRAKLVVDLPPDEVSTAETMWVVVERTDGDLFKVDNVPVFAYGLALNDVVRAERRDDDRWHFVEVVKLSGLLTVRVCGLHADERRFSGVVALLAPNAVASERYAERYVAYAMDPVAFANVEAAIDNMIAGDEKELFVEIGNDQSPES